MDEHKDTRQFSIMRWISFAVVTLAFVASVANAIVNEKEINNTLCVVFLIITSFAWGAVGLKLIKYFTGKL